MKNAAKRILVKAIADRVKKSRDKAMVKVQKFVVKEVKQTMSVQAPVRKSKKTGRWYATEPARPGAPIRRVSGAAYRSVTSRIFSDGSIGILVKARSRPPRRFNYPRYHEYKNKGMGKGSGRHPYVAPTVRRIRRQLKTMVGKEIAVALRHR